VDAHAQTVTVRLRSPLVAPDVGYDPFSVVVMTDPYPLYQELRAQRRVVPLPQYDAFALTRFDDVWRVLADRDRFSIFEGPVFHRDALLRHHVGPPPTTVRRPVPTFSMLDPPEHTRLRQALVGPFRPRAVTPMEDAVRRFARARLDQLDERDEFDVRHDYASPVAAQVAALQLGFPVEDAELLVGWVNAFVAREPDVAGISKEGLEAQAELHAYLVDLVAERRATRGDGARDLVDQLCEYDGPHGALDDSEIAVQLSTLFIGGSETLPKTVAGGCYELSRAPEQRAALAAAPARASQAFEEMLRHQLPLQFVGRTLTVDTDVAGVPMRAGQRVVLLLICANRDEREFDDPERFDLSRSMERHLGFGHGVHVCIGAHVARLEGTVLVQELIARCPAYEVVDTGLEREVSEFHVGWAHMPIRPGMPPASAGRTVAA
jgi:cytochrome P450